MIRQKFKIEITVRNQNDFNRLRALALFSELFTTKEISELMNDTFDEYYPVNPALESVKEAVRNKTISEFDIYEPYPGFMEEQGISESAMWAGICSEWWENYIWEAIARWSPRAGDSKYFASFEHNIDKALQRMNRSISNSMIELVRNEMTNLSEEVKNNPPVVHNNGKKLTLHVQFVWKSREDKRVCSACNKLDGILLDRIPNKMPHLNCRCDFVVYEWWTDEDGKVVADRIYEIEQNKKNRGYGYNIKQGKVTSKLKNGTIVTVLDIDDDGNIKRITYKK